MREKLIELLDDALLSVDWDSQDYPDTDKAADILIANGVTIAKWIPVTERLPEKDVLVLCIGARGGMFLGRSPSLFSDGTAYFVVPNARSCRYATHWMPLPEPPKESTP
jgi:hypothetical protein